MKDFVGLRKEIYRSIRGTGFRRDHAYYEELYNYVVGKETDESGFSEKLIDLIILNENIQAKAPDLESFLPYFSLDPVYDRYLIDFIRSGKITVPEYPDLRFCPKNSSPKNYLKAWDQLKLELTPPEAIPWSFTDKKYDFLKQKGLIVIQFLFYGDPGKSGLGNSGGLATLLAELGEALSEKDEITGVITVAVDNSKRDPTAIRREPSLLNNKHILARLSLTGRNETTLDYSGFQARIEAEIESLFAALPFKDTSAKPIFHVRYLDSASLATSIVASKHSIPLIATLTPDPHRKIVRWQAGNSEKDFHERLAEFHRLIIGDKIVELAQGILGIGKKSIVNVLLPYYPQLEDNNDKEITGIDEGINPYIRESQDPAKDEDLNGEIILPSGSAWNERPLILNVGRLNRAKGQLNLLHAYNDFSIWKTHNLLIIGGNFDDPTGIEREIIDEINHYLKDHPLLKKKVSFQHAKPNKVIRKFQQDLKNNSGSQYPDVYLCSSLKEEFGLSILEAMSAGMIILAPLSGGAGEYIRHGVNGFLIDTSSSAAIGNEFETYLYRRHLSPKSFTAISANARKTIIRKYSLEKIAADFINFYKKIINKNY